MAKRFILFGDGAPGEPIEAVASDCAAIYALNGRLSSDEEVRHELLSYGLTTVTEDDISQVRERVDQLTTGTESDLQEAPAQRGPADR